MKAPVLARHHEAIARAWAEDGFPDPDPKMLFLSLQALADAELARDVRALRISFGGAKGPWLQIAGVDSQAGETWYRGCLSRGVFTDDDLRALLLSGSEWQP